MNHTPGWIPEHELNILTEWCAQIKAGSPILEVGSFLGRSSVHLALLNPTSKVVCVDIWEGAPRDYVHVWDYNTCSGDISKIDLDTSIYMQFLKNTHECDNIRAIRCPSDQFEWFLDEPPGMIFIDADHSYEAVMQDLHLCYSKWHAHSNTLICGHDYGHAPVTKAVNDYAAANGLSVAHVHGTSMWRLNHSVDKPHTSRQVFDCFLYNGETTVLELRLLSHAECVDEFVIVESGETFSGHPKQQTWDWDNPVVQQFRHKIQYHFIPSLPATADAWVRESAQRNSLAEFVQGAHAQDWILISDVDEILNSYSLAWLRNNSIDQLVRFEQTLCYFYLNWQTDQVWDKAVAVRAHVLHKHSAEQVRMHAIQHIPTHQVKSAGWHFSYLMTQDQIKNKIRSFSHQEFNNSAILDNLNLCELIDQSRDIYHRNIKWFKNTHVNSLPECVHTHAARWEKWLL